MNEDNNYSFMVKSFKLISGRKDGYKQMYIRPFVSNITNRDIENMCDKYITTGLIDSDNKHSMLTISSGVNSKAGVNGGWGNIRYIFVLDILCFSQRSGIKTELKLRGYTEPTNQIRIGNNYDINLTYIINDCKKIILSKSDEIINIIDLGVIDHHEVDETINTTLRPSDVIDGIQLRNISNQLSGMSIYANNEVDRTNATFNREHNSSNAYLSSMFDVLSQSKTDATVNNLLISDNYNKRTNHILKGASKRLDQTSISMEPFFQIINNSLSSPGFNKFNLKLLKSVIPTFSTSQIIVAEVEDRTALDAHLGTSSYLNAGTGYICDMGQVDVFTSIVYDIHNSTHTFMKNNFIGSIDFMVNNLPDMNDAPMMRPKAKYRLINVLMTDQVKKEQQAYIGCCVNSGLVKLANIIDALLNKGQTFSDTLRYDIHIKASVLETNIALVVNGETEKRLYRFPSFADMNFSPMLGNKYDMEKLIADFSNMTTAIQENLL